MAEPILFDARIEELLREVAADPRSSLLRVPRPARLGVVLGRRPVVGVATAGLSAAERELVAAHRGELAWLLRKLAIVRLFESPKAATTRVRTCISGGPRLATDRREWVDATRTTLEGVPAEGPVDPGRELLERCVRDAESIGSLDVTDIAAAANLLDPTDQARIYAGQWLASEAARLDAARDALHAVLSGRPTPSNESLALMNLGWIAAEQDRIEPSCKHYEEAARCYTPNAAAACCWLSKGLESTNTERLRRAAATVNDRLTEQAPELGEFLGLLAAQARGPSTLSAVRPEQVHLVLAEFRGPAGVIANARQTS